VTLDWQSNGRHWSERGNAGVTVKVLNEAIDVCRGIDLLDAHDRVGLATDMVSALVPESGHWPEQRQALGHWFAIRSALVNGCSFEVASDLLRVTRDNLIALRERLTTHVADARAVAELERQLTEEGLP
jgi:hypothetical protein